MKHLSPLARILVIYGFALQFLDLSTTLFAMHLGMHELNPVMNLIVHQPGLFGAFKAGYCYLLWQFATRPSKSPEMARAIQIILIVHAALFTGVVASNFWHLAARGFR